MKKLLNKEKEKHKELIQHGKNFVGIFKTAYEISAKVYVHGFLKWLIEHCNSDVLVQLNKHHISCHKIKYCDKVRRCTWKKSGWHIWHECKMVPYCVDRLRCKGKYK